MDNLSQINACERLRLASLLACSDHLILVIVSENLQRKLKNTLRLPFTATEAARPETTWLRDSMQNSCVPDLANVHSLCQTHLFQHQKIMTSSFRCMCSHWICTDREYCPNGIVQQRGCCQSRSFGQSLTLGNTSSVRIFQAWNNKWSISESAHKDRQHAFVEIHTGANSLTSSIISMKSTQQECSMYASMDNQFQDAVYYNTKNSVQANLQSHTPKCSIYESWHKSKHLISTGEDCHTTCGLTKLRKHCPIPI